LGADAIGLVFFPPSPRYVNPEQARAICNVLPDHVSSIGVFNDPSWEALTDTIDRCGLNGVQLHGSETPEFIDRLRAQYNILIIKGLFADREPWLADAVRYNVTAYLVECGRGPLPGGNAEVWDWGAACDFASNHPTVLAGGLTPDNVLQAIEACRPDAVDVSSGLEAAPGHKDMAKVERFIANVRRSPYIYQDSEKSLRPIFL
jgi:phosphoribosylanthranilate isomerase